MTPDLIGKHVAIKDYPVHLVEGVYSCRYNDIIYCRFKIPLRQGEFAYPIWSRRFLTPVSITSS